MRIRGQGTRPSNTAGSDNDSCVYKWPKCETACLGHMALYHTTRWGVGTPGGARGPPQDRAMQVWEATSLEETARPPIRKGRPIGTTWKVRHCPTSGATMRMVKSCLSTGKDLGHTAKPLNPHPTSPSQKTPKLGDNHQDMMLYNQV